jgi:hypothetical protein
MINAVDTIIWNDDTIELTPQLEALMKYVAMDTLVAWYVEELYESDFEEMALNIGKDNAKTIEDYYDLHCC